MEGHLWEFTLSDKTKFLVSTESENIDEALQVYRQYKGYSFYIVSIKYLNLIDIVQ